MSFTYKEDGKEYALSPNVAKGIWAKVSDSEHPHTACVEMMTGKIDDPHAFCTAAEKLAAGTTPAERAAEKNHDYSLALNGVEIFAIGKHNGDEYTQADLDAMVSAFGELDYRPPLKAGHCRDKPGMPALGWVANLRREGSKLLADFVDMPELVYNAIKDKMYNTVSSEIYWNLERAGKKFSRALKAVALLGADIPAVANLKPLHEMFGVEAAETVKYGSEIQTERQPSDKEIDMNPDEIKKLVGDTVAAALAEFSNKFSAKGDGSHDTANLTSDQKAQRIAELEEASRSAEAARKAAADALEAARADATQNAERIKNLEEEHRKVKIEKLVETCRIPALRGFVRQYADLATREADVHVYDAAGNKKPAMSELEQFIGFVNGNAARLFTVVSTDTVDRKGDTNPSDEVDRRITAYMAQHPKASHHDALHAVLDADPVLKADYAQAG